MQDSLAKSVLDRFATLRGLRDPWESHWQEIADYVVPERSFSAKHSPGARLRHRIYDSTAPTSNERLRSALSGLLVNPSLMWFNLGLYGPDDEKAENRAWLDVVRDIILEVFNRPDLKFYPSLDEFFQDVAAFGTAGLFHRKMPDGATYYQAIPLPSLYIDEDSYGRVNTVFRRFELSVAQAVDMFSKDRLPEKVQKLFDESKFADKHWYVQGIYPRSQRDPSKSDAKNKAWASVVVHEAEKEVISESGFDQFPFSVARWSKAPGERYGRGPAMKVLPEILMVNAMSKTIIEAAQKIADPPVQMPDDGFMMPLSLHPGGINYYRSGTKDRIEPMFTGARPDLGVDMIEQRRQVIREAHYLDMLDLPMLDRMTATEVMQRQANKMQLFSPVISRLVAELLDPIIVNTFHNLASAGQLPKAPPSLDGRRIRIHYVSPLALSQKSSEAINIQRYLEFITPLANVDPGVIDSIHPDRYARAGKSIFSVPERIFRTEQELEQKKQRDRDLAEAAQQAEIAKTGAEAMKAGASAMAEMRQ